MNTGVLVVSKDGSEVIRKSLEVIGMGELCVYIAHTYNKAACFLGGSHYGPELVLIEHRLAVSSEADQGFVGGSYSFCGKVEPIGFYLGVLALSIFPSAERVVVIVRTPVPELDPAAYWLKSGLRGFKAIRVNEKEIHIINTRSESVNWGELIKVQLAEHRAEKSKAQEF